MQLKQIRLTLSIEEIIALSLMLAVGKNRTPPEEKKKVKCVLDRLSKSLKRYGVNKGALNSVVNI